MSGLLRTIFMNPWSPAYPLGEIGSSLKTMTSSFKKHPFLSTPLIPAGAALAYWGMVPLHEMFHAGAANLLGVEVKGVYIDEDYLGVELFESFLPIEKMDLPPGIAAVVMHEDTNLLKSALITYAPYTLNAAGLYALKKSVEKGNPFLCGIGITATASFFEQFLGDFSTLGIETTSTIHNQIAEEPVDDVDLIQRIYDGKFDSFSTTEQFLLGSGILTGFYLTNHSFNLIKKGVYKLP